MRERGGPPTPKRRSEPDAARGRRGRRRGRRRGAGARRPRSTCGRHLSIYLREASLHVRMERAEAHHSRAGARSIHSLPAEGGRPSCQGEGASHMVVGGLQPRCQHSEVMGGGCKSERRVGSTVAAPHTRQRWPPAAQYGETGINGGSAAKHPCRGGDAAALLSSGSGPPCPPRIPAWGIASGRGKRGATPCEATAGPGAHAHGPGRSAPAAAAQPSSDGAEERVEHRRPSAPAPEPLRTRVSGSPPRLKICASHRESRCAAE